MSEEKGLQTTSQMLIYQAEDGQTKIEVQLQDETVWLTQKQMAELFQTSKQNIGQHLKNIFEEGELEESSVVKKFFTTAADGKRYQTSFYSLDARRPGALWECGRKGRPPSLFCHQGSSLQRRQQTDRRLSLPAFPEREQPARTIRHQR